MFNHNDLFVAAAAAADSRQPAAVMSTEIIYKAKRGKSYFRKTICNGKHWREHMANEISTVQKCLFLQCLFKNTRFKNKHALQPSKMRTQVSQVTDLFPVLVY